MSKKIKSNNRTIMNKEEAPATLEDSLFFGLQLDDDQKKFRDAIYDKDKLIVLCNAKAGTGKTTVAVGVAYIMVQYGLYNGIVYIASPTMEQKQGYLPGDQTLKNAPYREPLVEACYSLNIDPYSSIISDDNIDNIKNGNAFIEFTTDTYLRGTNFENKVVIIDEAQNFYFDELKKALTRIHDNCKVIVIGHDKQCDLYKNQERSGFVPYLNAFKKCTDPRVSVCELTINHRGWVSTFCDNVQM
jgi:phosphate starvation-inducible protein PhoH and related proteins